MNEYKQEAEYWKWAIASKFDNGELDHGALNRILKRIYDLAYINGRLDGRKYDT